MPESLSGTRTAEVPGFFGTSSASPALVDRLTREWRDIAPRVETRAVGRAVIGRDAGEAAPLEERGDGSLVVRDHGCVGRRAGSELENAVTVWPHGLVELSGHVSGVLPLYWAEVEEGFAFATFLRPMARALGAAPDRVGVAEFLRFAYTTAGRTLFVGVRRVCPGQVVRWEPGGSAVVEERARTWVGLDTSYTSPDEVAESLTPIVKGALERTLPAEGDCTLMMSAGWDSRTLIATAAEVLGPERLRAFSHGDLASRELRLAKTVSALAGIRWQARTIGPDAWDLDHLDQTFRRTETLVFPHWSWAGRVHHESACLLSGVMGEVLGGHYGQTQLARGPAKGFAIIRTMTGSAGPQVLDLDAVHRDLGLTRLDRPWYLHEGVEGGAESRSSLLEAMNEGIRSDLERLVKRGVTTDEQLREAFVSEHRGVQYISAQALAARWGPRPGVPFGDGALLEAASRVPGGLKVHNRVSRALGRRLAPELNRVPMAATLVPASWPLALQEASRVVRRVYEDGRTWLSVKSRGGLPAARLGWVDFEFLRTGTVLADVVDSLSADLWDRERLEASVRRVTLEHRRGSLHPLFDQMGKILTVDRMLS
jgi:asparagine synthetase B (glutamine-hydrolysing)